MAGRNNEMILSRNFTKEEREWLRHDPHRLANAELWEAQNAAGGEAEIFSGSSKRVSATYLKPKEDLAESDYMKRRLEHLAQVKASGGPKP
eukprot:Skav207868  [mRNA]  locus=scaffold1988:139268:139540:+ [translate_table: standard]